MKAKSDVLQQDQGEAMIPAIKLKQNISKASSFGPIKSKKNRSKRNLHSSESEQDEEDEADGKSSDVNDSESSSSFDLSDEEIGNLEEI